ncbi:MAG: sigma-70 family RNA polymerase sigma factor, partial [Candidatus Latescibacteria bacterium]|nr:sigma-70 family RNA polymerase sigma factor [Candidatus Latescibacterota bacterium]
MPVTRDSIIEKAQTGDHAAYTSLLECHGPAVYGRIARQVNDMDDVKDLVQEVFIVIFTRLDQLQHPDRFPQWLMTITDNTVRSWHRRRFTRLRNEDLFESESVDHNLEHEFPQQLMLVRKAIAKLSGAHRQVVVHHYLNGYSYRTIAGLLGVKENTVRSRLQKARTNLKREVIRMGHTTKSTQTLRLDATDLRAMRWATKIVSKDPERAALGALYLDHRGFIVATDGHRMLVQASPTMKTLSQSILL